MSFRVNSASGFTLLIAVCGMQTYNLLLLPISRLIFVLPFFPAGEKQKSWKHDAAMVLCSVQPIGGQLHGQLASPQPAPRGESQDEGQGSGIQQASGSPDEKEASPGPGRHQFDRGTAEEVTSIFQILQQPGQQFG